MTYHIVRGMDIPDMREPITIMWVNCDGQQSSQVVPFQLVSKKYDVASVAILKAILCVASAKKSVASVAILRAPVCVAEGQAVAVVRAPGLYPPYLGPLAIPPPANHPHVICLFRPFMISKPTF